MITTIDNGIISLSIESLGAEIKSLKKNGKEYMWSADKAIWGRTAPILFPLAGALKDKKYLLNGKEYLMGQHGFARDSEFTLKKKSKTKLVYILKENETTLLKYPFKFILEVSFEINESTVLVNYKVSNENNSSMTFSIGSHPGFMTKDNYGFIINNKEQLELHHLTKDGMVTNKKENISLDKGYLPITEELFSESAIVIEDPDFKEVSLVDDLKNPVLEMKFDANTFLLWKPANMNAPFVCIEPWFGHGDFEDFNGEWEERSSSIRLEKNESFKTFLNITIKE